MSASSSEKRVVTIDSSRMSPSDARRRISGMSVRVRAPNEPMMRRPRRTSRVISTGAAVVPGGDADRHHAAAVADHLERLDERLGPAERFERHVDAAAVGQRPHAFDRIAGVASTRSVAPSRRAVSSLSSRTSIGDDLRRAERLGHLDDVQPDAAGRDDGDAFARRAAARMADRAIRREHRTAEDRRLRQRQARRQRKHIRRRHDRIFRQPGLRIHRQWRAVETPQPRRAVVQGPACSRFMRRTARTSRRVRWRTERSGRTA